MGRFARVWRRSAARSPRFPDLRAWSPEWRSAAKAARALSTRLRGAATGLRTSATGFRASSNGFRASGTGLYAPTVGQQRASTGPRGRSTGGNGCAPPPCRPAGAFSKSPGDSSRQCGHLSEPSGESLGRPGTHCGRTAMPGTPPEIKPVLHIPSRMPPSNPCPVLSCSRMRASS